MAFYALHKILPIKRLLDFLRSSVSIKDVEQDYQAYQTNLADPLDDASLPPM